MGQTPHGPEFGRWVMTGAAGQVGRHLRRGLGGYCHELIVTDSRPIDDPVDGEHPHVLDVRDVDRVVDVFAGADGVIHLGGLADEDDFRALIDVNVLGTYNVLEACRIARVRRVLYASSNRATGFYPTTTLVGPDGPVRPDGLYGVSKAACEACCRLYADKFGLQVACLRIGSFEQRPTTPRELHTWLSPADCTRAFLSAMRAQYSFTTFYAVSANAQPWWDVAAGRAIGFEPVDDAADYADHIVGEPEEPQGGHFASKEFTLSKQTRQREI